MKKKEISTQLAFLPILFMAFMVYFGNILFGIKLEFILLLASFVAAIIAIKLGYTWDELLEAYSQKFSKAFPAILILIAIGGVVGTWMYCGTVPMFIYYGLKFLNPEYVVVTAFIVTSIISVFTGTSWGSAATSGVAFMGIAEGMGVPLPIVAGAIISGAFLGDKVSPVSDTTNLSAMSSEIPVYEHIRGMLPNVIITGIISIIAFLIVGNIYNTGSSVVTNDTILIMKSLATIYKFNIFMVIPPAIVFIGGYYEKPALLLMLSSSFVAIIVGFLSNGFSIQDGVISLISGFNVNMSNIETITEISPRLLGLLNRGGFASMMSGAVLFCFLAMPFGSFMELTGGLDKVVSILIKYVSGIFSLIGVTFVSGALINGITGNGQFSLMTTGQLFKESFNKMGVQRSVLSRTMENSMTLLECLLPWHVTAIYMSTTLGVSTTDYMKWSFFNIFGIVFFFIQSYMLSKKQRSQKSATVNS